MEIKFDASAAEHLIQQMNNYCYGIQKEAKELLEIVKSSDCWKDNQRKAFASNMEELAKDLNQALRLEYDYMCAFSQRVKELKG